MNVSSKTEPSKLIQKLSFIVLFLCAQISNLFLLESEVLHVIHNTLKSSKYRITAAEGQLTEITLKHRFFIMCTIHPMRVHHVNLIFIRMQS
ncbi:hypothetical protein D3C73_1156380 [compost metagenome]